MKSVEIKGRVIGGRKLSVLCGPCVIEGEEETLRAAEFLKKLFEKKEIDLVFKSSYDKANRTSYHSYRGPGLETGLRILEKVQKEFDLPVVSDVHTPEEVESAKEVLDILQIPAFLCRQTDLVVACGKTEKCVQVKKGQFLAPWDMRAVVEKLVEVGNEKILLIDRGTSFGYNNLVSDMRAIPVMQTFGFPVGFDATHSVQLPGGNGSYSSGQREFIAPLAKAALAAGANFLFLEAHPEPTRARSDALSQIPFEELSKLLDDLKRVFEAVHV